MSSVTTDVLQSFNDALGRNLDERKGDIHVMHTLPCVGLAWDMCNVLIPRVLHLIISVAVQIPKRQDRNWFSVIIIWQ